jgi:hypothetical protein
MRFMGWSYFDLQSLPADYLPVLFEWIQDLEREADERRRSQP